MIWIIGGKADQSFLITEEVPVKMRSVEKLILKEGFDAGIIQGQSIGRRPEWDDDHHKGNESPEGTVVPFAFVHHPKDCAGADKDAEHHGASSAVKKKVGKHEYLLLEL